MPFYSVWVVENWKHAANKAGYVYVFTVSMKIDTTNIWPEWTCGPTSYSEIFFRNKQAFLIQDRNILHNKIKMSVHMKRKETFFVFSPSLLFAGLCPHFNKRLNGEWPPLFKWCPFPTRFLSICLWRLPQCNFPCRASNPQRGLMGSHEWGAACQTLALLPHDYSEKTALPTM